MKTAGLNIAFGPAVSSFAQHEQPDCVSSRINPMSTHPATTSDPIKVALVGATGKMGQYASAAINSSEDLELVAELASQDSMDNMRVTTEYPVESMPCQHIQLQHTSQSRLPL